MWKLWNRVSRRLSGRPPAPFVDNDDPISSTWTSALSSGRQPNALWVTPSQRIRRNSKSVACATRATEMWTIKEEAEVDEENVRVAHDGDVATTSDLNPSCSFSSSRSPANLVQVQSPGFTGPSSGSICRNTQTHGLGSSSSDSKQLALNPADLYSQSVQLGKRRTSSAHGPHPNSHHHHQQNHHRQKHHLHSHQHPYSRHSRSTDIWDLFSADPAGQHSPSTRLNINRRNSADSVSTRLAKRSSRDRWKFLQNIQSFLRGQSGGQDDPSKRGDSGCSGQPSATTQTDLGVTQTKAGNRCEN